MLASDSETLPDQVRDEVVLFFDSQHQWLAEVLRDGQERGEIRADLSAEDFAAMFVSSLEGSMMVSRGIKRPQDLETALDILIQLAKT